jgi:hypothetical protein
MAEVLVPVTQGTNVVFAIEWIADTGRPVGLNCAYLQLLSTTTTSSGFLGLGLWGTLDELAVADHSCRRGGGSFCSMRDHSRPRG